MKQMHLAIRLCLLVISAALAGCAPAAEGASTTTTDPFAYCAAVGTADTPGPEYAGAEVPEAVALGLRQALEAPETPLDALQGNSFWRCMDGEVYACFVGANLPCQARADTDRTPTQAEVDYCEENPEAEVIPAAVTGRETVYAWRCTDGAPEIERQVFEPDAQSFVGDIWYRIPAP